MPMRPPNRLPVGFFCSAPSTCEEKSGPDTLPLDGGFVRSGGSHPHRSIAPSCPTRLDGAEGPPVRSMIDNVGEIDAFAVFLLCEINEA
jgi:hypothetical protein